MAAATCQTEEGCSLHAILPRALARLSETNFKNNPDKKVDEILTALQEADLQETSEDQMDLAGLLAQIQHGEEASFAQVNQKRRVLTFEAFRDKDLTSKTAAVESLMKPNVHQMDILFERTQCIADLSKLLPSQTAKRCQLREKFLWLSHQISSFDSLVFMCSFRCLTVGQEQSCFLCVIQGNVQQCQVVKHNPEYRERIKSYE